MTKHGKPDKLVARLGAVHRRDQQLHALMGLTALSRWCILLFLAILAVDLVVNLPALVRGVTLVLLLAVSVTSAWRTGWRHFKRLSLSASALKVEDTYRNLESLVVSGVQLSEQEQAPGTSAAMSALTVRKADEASHDLKPHKVVPFGLLRRPASRVALLCAALCIIAALNLPLLKAGLTRVFAPWQAAAYPTRTVIELASEAIVVKEGDSVTIRAGISGEIPAKARLSLRTGKGRPHKRDLPIVDKACEYKVASAFRSFDYAISAGDVRSDWQTVKVVSAPRVAATRIRLLYPDYMNRHPETMDAMTLAVPEGATIEWDLRLDCPISRAAFSMGDDAPTPLEVSKDGLTVTHRLAADASGTYAFSWVEKEHAFSFKTAKHYLQVAPDQAPQVELASPRNNLFATIGRELTLAYRARDDHGIGDANIVYRRGKAEEKQIPFAAAASEGRALRDIDWDYREALQDLEVGESVTFAIEVSDRYPPPGGPHRARSESRRVSFLSKEDYLAKIHEQRERLLAQLRAVYRQERAAYEAIRSLNPQDDAFEQTCFLESARQDILVERLALLAEGITELVADLKANHIEDRTEFDGLTELRASLAEISATHINPAAAKLRDLGPSINADVEDVLETAKTINTAARELSRLVLRLGVREAMEVFATELHVIAESQSALRVETIELGGEGAALVNRQQALAEWVARLLQELSGDRDYSKAPLTIVRLARMVKDLRDAGVAQAMEEGAALLRNGDSHNATLRQGEIISDLFDLECRIRVGSEYEALLKARELFTSAVARIERATAADSGMTTAEVAHLLTSLHRDVRLLILPPVPAPAAPLLAEKPTDVPPVDELVAAVQESLQQGIDAEQPGDHVRKAAAAFRELAGIIDLRLDDVTRVARYAGHSGMAMERSGFMRELLASQMRLTEKTEDAEYDETSAVYLAPSQRHLSKEVLKMRGRLERKNRGPSASEAVVPMIQLLEQAAAAMVKAAPPLEADKPGDAIEHQDDALDALQGAMSFASHESDGWMGLANLLMTAEGIAVPARYMRDVVAEQRDLIAATGKSTPDSRQELLAIQKNLALAVLQVSELLAGTGSALDFEQAMLFAGSDMGSSVLQLEAGNAAAAMKAQELAVESVGDLSRQFDRSEQQLYYFVTVLEFLQQVHTDGVALSDQLGKLRQRMEEAADAAAYPSVDELAACAEAADSFCSRLVSATGRPDYSQAHASVASALTQLKAADRDACLDDVFASEGLLKESMVELRELVAKTAFIPSIEPIEAPPEYDVMLEMVDLLLEQQRVALSIYRGGKESPTGLVPELRDVQGAVADLLMSTDEHTFVVAARKAITEALSLLEEGSGMEAYARLHESETMLRQCILEYVLYYVEIKRPRGSRRKKKGKSSIVTMFKMTNKFRPAFDKDWGGVEGEDPEAGRSEWEVLGRRDRAALHENFVRELPLEYREFLKDYYERLAR